MNQITLPLSAEDIAVLTDIVESHGGLSEQTLAAARLMLSPSGEDFPMVSRCCCNQPDQIRVRFHERGDLRFCRDTIDAGVPA